MPGTQDQGKELQIVKNASSELSVRQRDKGEAKASLLQPSVVHEKLAAICWGQKAFSWQ